MSKRLLTAEAEILEPVDFDNLTLFQQAAVDDLIEDAIAYPAHWAGFVVSAADNAQVVDVTPGRYFEGRIVYANDAGLSLNLQTHLPLVVSDERWVALILRGTTETEDAVRPFKDLAEDADDGAVVMLSTPKVETRKLGIVVQQGLATPAPAVKPVVAETDCCIAFVRLKTSGVQEIVPNEAARVKSLYEHEGRIVTLEVNLASLFIRAETLETDLANLSAYVTSLPIPRPEIIRQMRRDIAALRIAGNVPAGARADWYDPGLLLDQWDPQNPAWYARVDEGIQFPYQSVREARLELVNRDNPLVRFTGDRMMPAWSEVKRIFNEGTGDTRNISQLVHTIKTLVKRTVSRSSTSYGPTVNVCENTAEWASAAGKQNGATFTKAGETFQVVAPVGSVNDGRGAGHQFVGVRQVKSRSSTTVYWDEVTEEIGVNGSVYGETFLVPSATICTSIELQFTKIGTDGDVHLYLAETDTTGAPLFDKVLGKSTLTAAELAAGGVGWKKFDVEPTYLTPGRRYAWYTVTTGNHQLQGTLKNAFSGGTSFLSTDGLWAQGDLLFDFCFRLNAARFANTRTVIEFKPMTIDGGMSEFRLLYPNWEPEGSKIEWEIRPIGFDTWSKLEAVEDNPLNGLPAFVELRCTILATQDLAPMIELSEFAVYRAARIAITMRAVSDPINLGLTTTTIQTYTVLDDFDPAEHVFSPRIMVGVSNTLIAPDVTTVIELDRPEHRAVLSTYTVPGTTSVVRTAPGGTITYVVNNYFIENTALFAL